jgi:hypothetical protein
MLADVDDEDFARWLAERDPEADWAAAAQVAERLVPALVGLDEPNAKAKVDAAECGFRVLRRDGASCGPFTLDRRPNRVNVAVEHGLIVSAEVY